MRLEEIEQIPSREEPIEPHAKHFANAQPIWTDPNDHSIDIRSAQGPTQEYLGVFKNQTLIALLIVAPLDGHPKVQQIKLTSVAKNERQKGFMRLLISYYRNHFGKLCSDSAQSPEAQSMWKALIQQPSGLKIVIWDMSTGNKRPAKGAPEQEIWNNEAETVLLVEDVDIQRYGNRKENIFEAAAVFQNQRRWDGPPHPLFP